MQAAAEQKEWRRMKSDGNALAKRVIELNVFCAHHQASLSRKPSILSIDGLATALVRMVHSQRTTKFQARFECFLDRVAASIDRRVVGQLPALIVESMNRNRQTLSICSSQLTDEQKEEIVCFFNHTWEIEMDGFSTIHWCTPGCCANAEATVQRAKKVLEIIIGQVPETPLLYRWKHFEPCLEYAVRGLAIHRVLVLGFAFILGKMDHDGTSDQAIIEETLDDDDANADPATRQRVRMNKTWAFFSSKGCLAAWC